VPAGKLSPETARIRASLARRHQSYAPDHPKVVEAQQDLAVSKLADHVKELVADWPELPPDKLDKVAALLRAGR
jgi:hypothetical protein